MLTLLTIDRNDDADCIESLRTYNEPSTGDFESYSNSGTPGELSKIMDVPRVSGVIERWRLEDVECFKCLGGRNSRVSRYNSHVHLRVRRAIYSVNKLSLRGHSRLSSVLTGLSRLFRELPELLISNLLRDSIAGELATGRKFERLRLDIPFESIYVATIMLQVLFFWNGCVDAGTEHLFKAR